MSDNAMENVKGTAKEVAGKATGSDELAREGQAQQDKAEAKEKATEAEREAARAEERQERHS
jgi:uncharacterized protein YjbJ (UPF0337 family)